MPKTHILVGAVRLRESKELVRNLFDVFYVFYVFMYLCICGFLLETDLFYIFYDFSLGLLG